MKHGSLKQKTAFIDHEHLPHSNILSVTLKQDDNIVFEEMAFSSYLDLEISHEDNGFALLLIFCNEGFLEISETSSTIGCEIHLGLHNLMVLKGGRFLLKSITDSASISIMVIEGGILERLVPEDHLFLSFSDHHQLWLNLQFNTSKKILGVLQELKQFKDQNYVNAVLTQAKYIELLGLQLESYENQLEQQPLPSSDIAKMDLAKHIITEHVEKTFTIAELAKLVGTNKQYLKNNFKIAYQTTVAQYTLSCKMNRSKELLMEGKSTISDIAQAVGYKHATHFTNAFKKFFGHLPRTLKGRLDFDQ